MKILVGRPKDQARELCGKLQQRGHSTVNFPCLDIQATEDQVELHDAVARLPQMDIVIFVSQHAVSYSLPKIQQQFGEFPKDVMVLTIGPATMKALQSHQVNITAQALEPFSSEALLELPLLQNVENKNIQIFRGEGGRTYLAESLEDRGAIVHHAVSYKRVKPTPTVAEIDALVAQEFDLIISHSGNSLENLFAILGDKHRAWLQEKHWQVMSERMVGIARNYGIKNVESCCA